MRIEDFLALLRGVTANGDRSWVACCPAHDDHNPSMSVSERDGKILVHCHAGCSGEEIVSALGLKMKDLFTDSARRGGRVRGSKGSAVVGEATSSSLPAAARVTKKSGSHGKLVCAYIYRDAAGAPLFKVERRVKPDGKKTFIAFHADEGATGGWAWGIHDRSGGKEKLLVPYVAPYHLPQVVAAAKAGRSCVIVEGEKDVESVEAMGLVATCNPFGAGKWCVDWPANWADWFRGLKSILIVADKDPATVKRKMRGKEVEKPFLVGQKHAWDVYSKLKAAGVGARMRIICMPDVNGVAVKDFTDWVQARQAAKLPVDKDALLAAIGEFGEWPESWHFTAEDLGDVPAIARAEKNGARDAASTTPPTEEEEPDVILERFGRLRAPRTPDSDVETYEVDFRLSARRVVRLSVDCSMRLPDAMAIMCGRVRSRLGDGESLNAEMVREIQVITVLLWLRSRGRFFWNKNFGDYKTAMYIDRKRGLLLYIEEPEFQSWLATEAEINREKKTWKYLQAMIYDAALDPRVSCGVVPAVAWTRPEGTEAVYISSGDSDMWRVRGGVVDKVQNGTDGVVFMRKKTLAPWKLVDGPGVDPFGAAKAFTGASWVDPASGPMNIRLWVLSQFMCFRTKPGLLLTGAFQSGKTRLALAIKELLGMRWDAKMDDRIHSMNDDDASADSFWVAIDSGKLEIFDNVDTRVKWLGDVLQTALTGGSSPRRKKYSDNVMITLRANASIVLTSNNPMFATEGGGGLADRLITVHLSIPGVRENLDDELTRDIEAHRDEYMTWIVRVLAKALQDHEPVDSSINKRHPEYGKFAVRCGRAFGNETGAVGALGAAEADKSLLPIRNDVVANQILRVLAATAYTLKFTSGEMSEKIIASMGDEVDEKTKTTYSARRVGKTLSKYLRQFATLLVMDQPRTLQGRTVYEAHGPRGIVAQGLLMSSSVGKVDINAENEETPIEGNAREFLQNVRGNPPIPPNARADDLLPSREEEEGEDIETMAEMEEFDL